MKFDVFSLFPQLFPPYLNESILKKAIDGQKIEVNLHNIRDWATDKHSTTDDVAYGGGGGMVMKPEPIFAAVEEIIGGDSETPIILLSPQGRKLNQDIVKELSHHKNIALLCGRYEGVDERVREHLVTDEISIGDFVLTGGELPALMLIDALARRVPGVLGSNTAFDEDSHASGLLEHPHYTRPAEFRGWEVPEILRSGNHKLIEEWRKEQSILRTKNRRPDMLED